MGFYHWLYLCLHRIRATSTREAPAVFYLRSQYSENMGQPGKVASPARGQLNRKNEYFPVRVRACEFGLARRIRQSRPASACSSPNILRLNLVLTYGIPPEFRGGVLCKQTNQYRASAAPLDSGSANQLGLFLSHKMLYRSNITRYYHRFK